MNKNKNVCLGRRGRPKKNQQRPSLNEYIVALAETNNFSFFPLETKEFPNGSFCETEIDSKFGECFRNWYLPRPESCCKSQDSDMNGPEHREYLDSLRVSLNNDPTEISINTNRGIYTNSKFLPFLIFTEGNVWKMAFSPPSFQNRCIFLAMGIHPKNSLLSQVNKRYNDKGTIQVWRIPFLDELEDKPPSAPSLSFEVEHFGLFCRYLEWVPRSESPEKKSIGLLFCVLGDGSANLLSVPFVDGDSPLTYNIKTLTIWSYLEHYNFCSGSIRIPCDDESLKIAGTTAEGALHVWTFEANCEMIASRQVIPVSQGIPLLSASWCPVHSSNLIVVCDNNGKISIVDFRRGNSIIKEFELSNRPITSITWTRFTNLIYLSHGTGAIVLSIDSGDYTQFTIEAYNKKKKLSTYEDSSICPILGSRSWACSSFLHQAIFGFNDGSTIIAPSFEFESKSFQEALLIKALVVNPGGGELELPSPESFEHGIESGTENESTSETNSNNIRLFNRMKKMVSRNHCQRMERMKRGTVSILWDHNSVSSLKIVDFLEVQCTTNIDPFLYPRLISQPFLAISYFGGLIAIHKFQ
ncbi:WD40-repeat containing protein [Cryptosporidium felis]|nr:WD40-repeat containing protein [Cryptosporidium felis]